MQNHWSIKLLNNEPFQFTGNPARLLDPEKGVTAAVDRKGVNEPVTGVRDVC